MVFNNRLIILLLISTSSFGQLAPRPSLSNTGNINTLSNFIGGVQSNVYFRPPRSFNNWAQQDSGGMFWFDSANTKTMWYHNGTNRVQIGAGGGTGTVTNVSTGFGMLGGPITTTGTVRVDSGSVLTVRRGYKIADSVSGVASTSLADSMGVIRDSLADIRGAIPSVSGYVPYTGANDSVRLGEHQIRAGQVAFDLSPTGSQVISGMYWDATNNTISVPLTADVNMQIGQELYVRARNNTGVTITNGQVVYINSAQGNNPTIALADADDVNTSQVIGVATEPIADNGTGFITVTGVVNGINTSAYNAGDALYLDTINGGLTKQILSSPHNVVFVGYALNSTNNGRIFVSPAQPIATDTNLINGSNLPPTQFAVRRYVLNRLADTSAAIRAAIPSVAGYATTAALSDSVSGRQKYSDTSTFDATRSWVNTQGYATTSALSDSVSGRIKYSDTVALIATFADVNNAIRDTTALSRRIDLLNTRQGANVASADTINLLTTTGNYVNVTGTTTIRGLSPSASGNSLLTGARRVVNFNGALTLTHNATTLILPGNVNRTTVAGDIAEFVYLGGVSWVCISYVPRTVTGTGSTMLAASPTTTGTLTTAAITASGTISFTAGTVTLGSSTGASTIGLGTGNTTTGNTKTINIGGAAASGSTQNINIGSTAVSGASQTITIGTAGVGTTALTGTVTATTQSPGDNSTRLATTAFVAAAVSGATGIQSVTSTNNSVLVSGTSTVNVMVDTSKATQWIVDQTIDSVSIGTGNGLSTNVRFGRTAFTSPTTATGIVAIGESACRLVTTGINNIAIGRNSVANSSVSVNGLVAVGTNNLNFSTGDNNTALGFQCMARAVSWSGIANAGVGANTGSALTTGSSNSWLGAGAANALTSGSSNTFVGVNSGNAVSTGGQNVILGSFTGNSGGLDIRTVSNRLVLSDGGGNIRAVHNATNWLFGTVTDASTGLVQISGNLGLNTAGNKLNIATGLNASVGTGTLSGGTATINTTAVTASSIIQLQLTSCSSCGTLYIGAITAGLQFIVNSTNVADASTFNYWIIN